MLEALPELAARYHLTPDDIDALSLAEQAIFESHYRQTVEAERRAAAEAASGQGPGRRAGQGGIPL